MTLTHDLSSSHASLFVNEVDSDFCVSSYSDVDTRLPPNEKYREISNLIEHPCVVQPPGEPSKPTELRVMLTKKERKKLRRQKRREAEKEKQEKIQFGLIEKPEPKVIFKFA